MTSSSPADARAPGRYGGRGLALGKGNSRRSASHC